MAKHLVSLPVGANVTFHDAQGAIRTGPALGTIWDDSKQQVTAWAVLGFQGEVDLVEVDRVQHVAM